MHIFYFRGLSTYGHDNAKWSIFDFGPIHQHIAREFSVRGIQIHPVTGIGVGSLKDMSHRAAEFVKNHRLYQTPNSPVHFLGHSAGGLIARLVLEELQPTEGKVLSCMTIASPHKGSKLANICIDMEKNYRGSALFMRSFGYNINSKKDFFTEFTEDRVTGVLPQSHESSHARLASIVCAAPRNEWCTALKMFYKIPAFKNFDLPSDGIVERDTQPFGDVIAELKIDHFRQAGFFGESYRFKQMCDVAADFFKTEQKRA